MSGSNPGTDAFLIERFFFFQATTHLSFATDHEKRKIEKKWRIRELGLVFGGVNRFVVVQ